MSSTPKPHVMFEDCFLEQSENRERQLLQNSSEMKNVFQCVDWISNRWHTRLNSSNPPTCLCSFHVHQQRRLQKLLLSCRQFVSLMYAPRVFADALCNFRVANKTCASLQKCSDIQSSTTNSCRKLWRSVTVREISSPRCWKLSQKDANLYAMSDMARVTWKSGFDPIQHCLKQSTQNNVPKRQCQELAAKRVSSACRISDI